MENLYYVVEWAGRHDFLNRDKVIPMFLEENQATVNALWDDWDSKTEALIMGVKNDDPHAVEAALNAIKEIIVKWTPIAAKRYAELLTK